MIECLLCEIAFDKKKCLYCSPNQSIDQLYLWFSGTIKDITKKISSLLFAINSFNARSSNLHPDNRNAIIPI